MLIAGCYERFLFGYKQDNDAAAQVSMIEPHRVQVIHRVTSHILSWMRDLCAHCLVHAVVRAITYTLCSCITRIRALRLTFGCPVTLGISLWSLSPPAGHALQSVHTTEPVAVRCAAISPCQDVQLRCSPGEESRPIVKCSWMDFVAMTEFPSWDPSLRAWRHDMYR